MSSQTNSTFEVKNWEEKSYSEIEGGPKLTHARVTQVYHGDVEGEGTLEYLMVYHANGTTDFFGLERVVGRIGKRSGSFVLRHIGLDDGQAAKDTCSIVSDSGTGELRGLRGQGSYTATRESMQVPFILNCDFE
jgi:hypothetical protein